jgi:hypothetical protein
MVRTELLLFEPISVAERVVRCAILLTIAEAKGGNVLNRCELHSWFGMKMMASLWWRFLLCTVLGIMIDFLAHKSCICYVIFAHSVDMRLLELIICYLKRSHHPTCVLFVI